jgi:hypothetical protein
MSLPTLPDHARLWLVALAARPDTAAETRLRQGLAEVLALWRHKGQAYQAAFDLLEPQLIAVAEPNLAAHPSGCAIDGMLRKVRKLAEQLGLELVDPERCLVVRQDDRLVAVPKDEIQACLEDGRLAPATPVLNLSLYNLAALRAGQLEGPLARTWVGRKFKLAVGA